MIGEMSAPSAPFRNGSGRCGPEVAAPLLGAHTREIAVGLLGLSDGDVDALIDEKVLW